jgi:HEAT repeat protein
MTTRPGFPIWTNESSTNPRDGGLLRGLPDLLESQIVIALLATCLLLLPMTTDLSALVFSLRSGDPDERQAAAEKLSQLGPAAQPAAVALVEACERDDEARESAVAALEELGPPPATDVMKLASLLQHPALDVAYWAATLLGRLEVQAAPAADDLIRALRSHAELAVRQRAAWALGKIGPAAIAAQEALRAAAAGSDPRLASLAREAIGHLQR